MGHREIDANEIIPGLYQGSIPPEGPLLRSAGVGMLVLAAIEHQPSARRFPGVAVLHAPLDDHLDPMTLEEVLLIRVMGQLVAEHVAGGGAVLVTCQAGLNRSGIITAAALCQLGLSPRQAVRQIRRQRPGALRNHSFVQHLPMVVGSVGSESYEVVAR
jgi:hypothetical protein